MLTAPEETYATAKKPRRDARLVPERELRRRSPEDFAGEAAAELPNGVYRRRKTGLRLTFAKGVPRSVWGRVAAGMTVLVAAGLLIGLGLAVERWLMHDPRFFLEGEGAIDVRGSDHLAQTEALRVFGSDLGRNIFSVPLAERQEELEQLPWVKRATVMRLLPNHLRVQLTERIPVAFVRNGGHVGLVDAEGDLLDPPADGTEMAQYSFPVVTGIVPEDPISTREARMKIYAGFLADLDSGGEKNSSQLSEVDLSDPEDLKAIIPDKGSDVLVHFGERDFLTRYHKYKEHLGEWKAQYPKLASVDMRYERQVVLEMQKGSTLPVAVASQAAPKLDAVGGGGKLAAKSVAPKALSGKTVVSAAKSSSAAKPATKMVASSTGVVRSSAKPVSHAGGKAGKPELVGYWSKDGVYHAPPGGHR